MPTMPLTTNVVSLNPAHGEVYSIQPTLCYKFCQYLATGWQFSPGTLVSSTIQLKVVLNTITLTLLYLYIQCLSKCTQMWSAMFIKTYLDMDSNGYQNVPRCGQQCLSKSTQMWSAMFIKTYLDVDSNVYQNVPRCGQQCLSKSTQVWTMFLYLYIQFLPKSTQMWTAMFIKTYLGVDSNVYQNVPRCGQQCLSKSTQVWTMFLYLYIQFLPKSTQMWTAMFIKTYLGVDSNVYQNVPRCGQCSYICTFNVFNVFIPLLSSN